MSIPDLCPGHPRERSPGNHSKHHPVVSGRKPGMPALCAGMCFVAVLTGRKVSRTARRFNWNCIRTKWTELQQATASGGKVAEAPRVYVILCSSMDGQNRKIQQDSFLLRPYRLKAPPPLPPTGAPLCDPRQNRTPVRRGASRKRNPIAASKGCKCRKQRRQSCPQFSPRTRQLGIPRPVGLESPAAQPKTPWDSDSSVASRPRGSVPRGLGASPRGFNPKGSWGRPPEACPKSP